MNKYWKLIIVGIVIVLSIGTFYIKSAMSENKYLEFEIQKQSGDKSEMESVVINGSYSQGQILNKGLTITSNSTTYKNEMSFLERIDGYNEMLIVRQLHEEHRNFMRGKYGSPSSFYEDESYLVYGEVDYQVNALAPRDFHFTISVLDKEKDKTNSFEVEVPDSNELEYMQVDDVQILDGKLKLFTKNMTRGNETVHLYSLDAASKKIINHKKLFSITDLPKNQWAQITILNETDPTKAHQNVVFRKSINEDVEQAEVDYVSQEVSSEFVIYNLKKNETDVIELPEEFKGPDQMIMFDESILYFVDLNVTDVVVTPYSLKDKKFNEELKLQIQIPKNTNEKVDAEGSPTVTIKGGKLYAVTPITDLKTSSTLFVASLETGESLYTGKIVPEEPIAEVKDYSLFVTDLQIK